ncbi:MAG: hypothetical protein U0361_21145 [Nitrospiraceae bacterium]
MVGNSWRFMDKEKLGIACPLRGGVADYDLPGYARPSPKACAEAVRRELYAPCMLIQPQVADRMDALR